MQMRPLSFYERGLQEPSVSLAELLDGTRRRVSGSTEIDIASYVEEILRSGFPGIRDLPEKLRTRQLDSYISRLAERDLPTNGVSVKDPVALRKWLAAYAAATATDASYTTILDAATPGEEEKPHRSTALRYRHHLERLFILDPIRPWIPSFTPLKRLKQSEKHHLVDPALAARLVCVGKTGLITGKGERIPGVAGTWLGALFESLAAQSVRVYAQAAGAHVSHLRTRSTDHEVDLIVENPDHSVVAIEVKLAPTTSEKDVKHLHWLEQQLGPRAADKVVINTGSHAYRWQDGVAVLPLALLGP